MHVILYYILTVVLYYIKKDNDIVTGTMDGLIATQISQLVAILKHASYRFQKEAYRQAGYFDGTPQQKLITR